MKIARPLFATAGPAVNWEHTPMATDTQPRFDTEPRLRLLGSPRWLAAGADGATTPFGLQRHQQLLAYLACLPGWAHRDELAEWLWPGRPRQRARSNLRKLLLCARRDGDAGGLPEVEARGATLRWAPATDVRCFEAALSAGRYEQALRWYGGPLLQGLDPALPQPALDWLRIERERLAAAWRRAVSGRLAELADQPLQRAACAEHALRLDPELDVALDALASAGKPSPPLLAPPATAGVPRRHRRIREEAVHEVLATAVDAVTDDGAWPLLLERLRNAVHAVGTMWVVNSFTQPADGYIQIDQLDDELSHLYLSRHQNNVWNRTSVGHSPGCCLNLMQMAGVKATLASGFYEEVIEPQGIQTVLALPMPIEQPHAVGGFGVALDAWRGAAVEEAQRVLQRLASPLARIARASQHWRRGAARQASFEAAFDALPMAVFVVAADARLLLANGAAERLLRAADGVALRGGLLCAAAAADTQALHREIARAGVMLDRLAPGGPLVLRRPSGRPALQAQVSPVADLRGRVALRQRPAALVYLT
jgi:PAS domain-containing protein